jgi:hypothetical protein
MQATAVAANDTRKGRVKKCSSFVTVARDCQAVGGRSILAERVAGVRSTDALA